MAGELVIACPTCAQKYKVGPERAGHRARCKKCGQTFRIEAEERIDDDTILGWVMQDEPSAQSVLGSTSIFQPPTESTTARRPTLEKWKIPPPPDKPRVRFDRINEQGAHFEFPAAELRRSGVRASFPYKCVHCLQNAALEVRLIVWADKMERQGAFHVREVQTKAHGRLDQMLRTNQSRWFEQVEPLSVLPPPFCNPFPYFSCHKCGTVDDVTSKVVIRNGEDFCRLTIANFEIACDFFRNNGGEHAPGYQALLDASQRSGDDRWQRLAFAVRNRISHWYKPHEGEHFLAFFRDSDFQRTETGAAGLLLTNQRLIFKKYKTSCEYDIKTSGRLEIEADRKNATVRITQSGGREATLHSNPVAASHLAKTLAKMPNPWEVKVESRGNGETRQS